MAVLDDIHQGIQSFNSIIRNSSTLGKLEGRMIGGTNDSMELLTRTVSRQIGQSLLGRITYTTDINCIRNPYSRRYENPDNTGVGNFTFGLPGSPKIGELYDVYYHEDDRIEFLDRRVAGDLLGYTHLQAAAEERNENPFLDKLFTVSTYNNFIEPEVYLNDVPFWRNLNNTSKRYTPRDPYLIFPLRVYPVSTAINGQLQVYNNLFEIYTTDNGPLQSVPVLNTTEYTEPTRVSYDRISSTEAFYQENGQANYGSQVDLSNSQHAGNATQASTLEVYGGNLKDIKGLLQKTNKLFNDGKIDSLINRFKTDAQNGETGDTVINSAFDYIHGYSRGRNLKKKVPTTESGYENPYCRVWTSHHRYSKYKDLIRPFSTSLQDDTAVAKGVNDGTSSQQFYAQGDGFRPFDGNTRLGAMSVLDYTQKGMPRPRIAPSYRTNDSTKDERTPADDIKKCMFSIENLAWKDINFLAQVIGNGDKKAYTFGQTLSEEQRGPNGGRIMWFPPYNLKFSEQVSANWNDNNFIGRGEPIKTYANTVRRGQLSFTILVDHPSIIDQYTRNNDKETQDSKYDQDQEILRYFAGCGPLEIKIEKDKKYVVTEMEERDRNVEITATTDVNTNEEFIEQVEVPDEDEEAPDITFKTVFFYPNNYSGEDYGPEEAMDILFNKGKRGSNTGYEVAVDKTHTGLTYDIGLDGKSYNGAWYVGPNRYGTVQTWNYAIDRKKAEEKLLPGNFKDNKSFGLNDKAFGGVFAGNASENYAYLMGTTGSGVNWASEPLSVVKTLLGSHLTEDDPDLNYVVPAKFVYDGGIKKTIEYLEKNISPKPKYGVKVSCVGYASTDGYQNKNRELAENRAKTVAAWFEKCSGLPIEGEIETNGNGELTNDKSVSEIKGKASRCAVATIKIVRDKTVEEKQPSPDSATTVSIPEESQIERKTRELKDVYEVEKVTTDTVLNTYDDEYRYFKQVNEEDDEEFIKKYISDKVKYFDPAFHSISPEGFNSRLTFLHQCTRQGPTIAASDEEISTHSMGAGNLSFGRPPFCVLRVGDFYYTKICIDSINIQYDKGEGIVWDLNPEGIGVQPMYADIDISFTFLGGSDLSGPIDRLQNAVTHNYYANTSVYDRRADYRYNFRNVDNDEAYAWEPTLTANGDNPEQNRSVHIKYSPTKEVQQEELLKLKETNMGEKANNAISESLGKASRIDVKKESLGDIIRKTK